MEEIIINDNIKIKKNKSIHTITFRYTAYLVIKSLIKTHIIPGASADGDYNSVKFAAQSVKTLEQFKDEQRKKNGKNVLTVPDIAKMVRSLVMQLDYLITNERHTFLGYNPKEIIVINDEKFAYLGSEFIANFDVNTNLALISCPFSYKDFFFSPELLAVTELPAHIHYKTSYFSLALLLLHSLLETNDFYMDYLKYRKPEKILEILNNHPLKDTRIYWLLSRCLIEEPKARSIIHL